MENEFIAEAQEQIEDEKRKAIVSYVRRCLYRRDELTKDLAKIEALIEDVRQGNYDKALQDVGAPF